MKKYWKFLTIPLLAILLGVGIQMFDFKESEAETAPPPPVPQPIAVQVNAHPTDPVTQRIGVNMSGWSTWGSSQYMRNVLMNPGLEAEEIDRITVIVQQTDKSSFSDGKGLGMPDDYWVGATFDVRSGESVGTKGTIKHSLKEGADGLPQYFPDTLPPLAVNDVVILTKETALDPVSQWWIPTASVPLVKVSQNPRPESTGQWSVALSPDQTGSAHLNFYLDAISDRAGILLPVNKPWELKLWVKAEGADASMNINFSRLNGTPPFLYKTITPSHEWQQLIFPINAQDTGAPATLQLNFTATTPGTTIYIDDVQLGPVQSANPLTVWNQDVIDMLKILRPSWLRDWQGQLGDTFKNRIADPFSRTSYTSRAYGGEGNKQFSYSIPDFLDLCSEVQANPWLIVPTSLSDEELTAFGQFLAQHADQSRFSQVIVEFGNENWNWFFRSSGIPIYASHGAVADRAFQFIAAAAGPNVKMRRVINGQYANPWLTQQYLQTAKNYDTMAIAPYFFLTMTDGSTEEENLNALFAPDKGEYKQNAAHTKDAHKTLAVYEVNLHTMSGTATAAERNPIIAGAASGSALAKRLLQGMFLNASPQLAFCFSQFDSQGFDIHENFKLWGINRDVSATKRLRPTGLAIQMLNQVIGGSLHAINPSAPEGSVKAVEANNLTNNLTMAAFRTDSTWTAAIVSANSTPVEVALTFPQDGRALPTYIHTLSSKTPTDTNETSENVTIAKGSIQSNQQTVTFSVPAYGFVVLTSDAVSPVQLRKDPYLH